MTKRNFLSLSNSEKRIYNEIYSSLCKFQTTFKFQGINSKTISKVLQALIDDNPQFFWITGNAKYEWTTRNGTILDITCKAELAEGISSGAVKIMYAKLNNTVKDIVTRAKQLRTHFEQILYVHDYIVDTTDYISNAPMRYTSYGCLVTHKAVCAGYAKAFQMIMNELGYECGYVRGADKDTESVHSSHAWNYIKIENEYYFIDVTWDDPKVENVTSSYNNKTRNYFCISEKEIALTHKISKKYSYPVCSGTKYNYYLYKGYFLRSYSFNSVKEIASKQLSKKGEFSIKFSSRIEANCAMTDLITKGRVYNIPGVTNQIIYTMSKSGLILNVKNT